MLNRTATWIAHRTFAGGIAVLALVFATAASPQPFRPMLSGIGYVAPFGTRQFAKTIAFANAGTSAQVTFDEGCRTDPPTDGPHSCPMLAYDPPFVLTLNPGCTAFSIDGGATPSSATRHVVDALTAGTCELTARKTGDPRFDPVTIPVTLENESAAALESVRPPRYFAKNAAVARFAATAAVGS